MDALRFTLYLLLPLVLGALTATVARSKGHSEGAWFLIGLLTGPFGLIAAAGLSDRALYKLLSNAESEPAKSASWGQDKGDREW